MLLSIPLKRVNDMPTAELAGKVVIDTSSCMIWRDGHYPQIDSGEKTAHGLRQEQLPESKGVKASPHIQAHLKSHYGRNNKAARKRLSH